ncbi:MAG TPA: methyltransferase domain-containing protein [Pirellulales bacterium]|nr:methyltransferase domain-containing protein [Pirellulales bacterium]
MSNTSNFNALAEHYAQFRPGYPLAIFEQLRAWIAADVLEHTPLLIDVGCGTGISTRRLRAAFGDAAKFQLVGLEPSDEMRKQATEGTPAADRIEFRSGVAESLPFADGSAALAMAAQAAHWFDRERFYAEAARVLAPGGIVALVFNNRRWQDDAFQEDFETLLERISPGYSRSYRDFAFLAELQAQNDFGPAAQSHVDWIRPMTCAEFFGMCLSTTYIHRAIEASSQSAIESEIESLWTRHLERDQSLPVPYRTTLLTAPRRNPNH